ncbi:hypothetical protein MMC34_008675 [Xylographa carneopallida]|nr:hypothetical protein [Xylographa carneopallida]
MSERERLLAGSYQGAGPPDDEEKRIHSRLPSEELAAAHGVRYKGQDATTARDASCRRPQFAPLDLRCKQAAHLLDSDAINSRPMTLMRSASDPTPVLHPPTDPRRYRTLFLSNTLPTLLISDPTTDTAAAALSLHTGNWHDPSAVPGLAHLTEHMMFMGSTAYPQEGAYSQYVLGHGGAVNGYTLSEETNFHFKVESAYLYGAMDRMAAAFVSPLLAESSITRELLAVHSEYSKNLLTEERRQWQVLATQALPEHPMHHFSTGSLHSLNRSDIHAEVVRFHHSHYSANAMRLVVIGRDSLNTLQYQAMRLFARIPNHHLHATLPPTPAAPYVHGVNLPSLTYMQPIGPSPTVSLYFPLPSQFHDHRHRTAEYVCYLLSHEGPSSLVARWRARGVVHHVNATLTVDLPSMAVLQYTLTLVDGAVTSGDFEDREQHGDMPALLTELVGSVFAYLSLAAAEADGRSRWQEWRSQLQVAWDWAQKRDPYELAPLLAKQMHSTPDEFVLDPPQHLQHSNRSTQQLLSWLTPDNAMVHVAARAYPFRYARREPWYSVPYTNRSLPVALLHQWSTRMRSHAEPSVVTLPASNSFIPDDFSLQREDEADINHPAVLVSNDYYRLYYDQALASRLPVTLLYFNLFSPVVDPSPAHQAYLLLATALVNDNLASLLYQARLVGYQAAVTSSPTGVHVQLSGVTQTFARVLQAVVDALLAVRVDGVRFAAVKASLVASLSSSMSRRTALICFCCRYAV